MADPTIILDIEPDWDSNPSVAFSFLTAFQDTPYYVEQRRPMLPQAVRSVNYKFVEKDQHSQKVINTLLASQGELICTPIFSEPIFVSSIVTGGVVIVATTDLTYLFNLRNCTYAVIIDMVTGASEMAKIASVAGQNIVVMTPISGTWIAAQTIVYPAMATVLKSIKQAAILNHVGSIDAEFEELAMGEEAASEWVGLDEQSCYPCGGGTVVDACSEYFNGANGTSLFSAVIEDTGYFAGGANVTIYNNSLRHVAVAGIPDGYQYQYTTTFSFLGEFDFYLSYSISGITNENAGWIYFNPLKGSSSGDIVFGVEWWYDGGGNINYYAYGPVPEMDYVETSQMSGKLRFTRDSANDIRIFYWNESLSRWEADGDTAGLIVDNFLGAFTPVFEVFSGFDEPIIDILDFITTSGCANIQPVV